jgi:hypothetical protein
MNPPGEPEVTAAKRRAVTLQDVADEAGVAVSTTSRALSNPDRVSSATRRRVQSIAMRLGYRHNRIATALETGRTPMLALLVADITNPHNFGLIRGAEAQARAAGLPSSSATRRKVQSSREPTPSGWNPLSPDSCWPAAACLTMNYSSWPDSGPSCCLTGRHPACLAS